MLSSGQCDNRGTEPGTPTGRRASLVVTRKRQSVSKPHKHCKPRVRDRCLAIAAIAASTLAAVPASAQLTERQMQLLANNCVQCHARPGVGAPIMGVARDWQGAVKRGEDALLINVVHGTGGMPPLGYCSACSEQDFRAMIRFLAGLPDGPAASQ